MIADAIKAIEQTAVLAAGVKGDAEIIHPLAGEPRHVYGLVTEKGFQRCEAAPPVRSHELHSVGEVAGFVQYAKSALSGKPICWYDRNGVVVILDDDIESRRDHRAVVRLTATPAWEFLNRAKGYTLTQKELLQVIRRDLWDSFSDNSVRDALVKCLRALSFVNSTTGHGTIETGRSSYGRDIEGETKSAGGDLRQFERLTLSVRLFDDPALTTRRAIPILLDDDPIEHTFQILPVAGSIPAALDAECAAVAEILSESGCPAFYGAPELSE